MRRRSSRDRAPGALLRGWETLWPCGAGGGGSVGSVTHSDIGCTLERCTCGHTHTPEPPGRRPKVAVRYCGLLRPPSPGSAGGGGCASGGGDAAVGAGGADRMDGRHACAEAVCRRPAVACAATGAQAAAGGAAGGAARARRPRAPSGAAVCGLPLACGLRARPPIGG